MKGYTNRTGLFYEYWLEVLIGNEISTGLVLK